MERKPGRGSVVVVGSFFLVFAILALAPGLAAADRDRSNLSDDGPFWADGHGDGMVCTETGAEVQEPFIPANVDVFDLSLRMTRALSRTRNFKIVGHSYFKGPWNTEFAQTNGLGAGLTKVRVHDGIAYLAGYSGPPLTFGILIADVSNPKDMKALSFLPSKPGTRSPYMAVNNARHILVFGNTRNAANPSLPPPGQPTDSGWSFWDVSNPASPLLISHLSTLPNGSTHGFEMDDRYLYACGQTLAGTVGDEFEIFDYADASAPYLVSSFHIQGQHPGEAPGPMDRKNPNGTAQRVSCHDIVVHKDRVYIAYRDAGLVVLDVTDRRNPVQLARYDYVPPFNGDGFGAAHSPAPVIADPDEYPKLVVVTDEMFDCPPGAGHIIDISDIQNPEVMAGERAANLVQLSTYRLPHVDDNFDFSTGKFVCRPGTQTIYVPWFDYRSASLFYQSWYDQGLRAWDISNPFLPREVGYFLSPRYTAPGRVDRQTREAYQDPDTGLIYVPDANGGGLTVLLWTGPIPANPPIPGAR
jgi:hypothetical protein